MRRYLQQQSDPCGEQTDCWCVTATVRANLQYTPAGTIPNETTLDAYIKQHNRFDWTNKHEIADTFNCSHGINNSSWPNDSLGAAFGLYHYSPSGYGYRDYYDYWQSTMNWKLILNIRATRDPAPATVMAGKHEVLVVGYDTLSDPGSDAFDSANTIYGFNIWDPWQGMNYPTSLFGSWNGGHGYVPDSWFALSDWNSNVYKRDNNEGDSQSIQQDGTHGSPYNGNFVAVLRAWTDASHPAVNPKNTTTDSYGTTWYQNRNGLSAVQMSVLETSDSASASTTASAATVASAVDTALAQDRLLGRADLGNLDAGYTIGHAVHVDSMEPAVASYELVEVLENGHVAAVALVDDVGAGYQLGELTAVVPGFSLPRQADMDAAVAAAGLQGHGRAVWGQTVEGAPRLVPFVVGSTATGKPAFAGAMPGTPEFALH